MPKFKFIFSLLLLAPFLSFGVIPYALDPIGLKPKKCVSSFDNQITINVEKKDPRYGSASSLTSQIGDHIMRLAELQDYVDHTLLKPEATKKDIQKIVHEALVHNFKAVCVGPCQVSAVKEMLKNTKNKKPLIATVIGFPTGAHSTSAKVHEAIEAYKNGAEELDMVINIGYIKERRFKDAESDIEQVVQSTPLPVKVIIETGLLTPQEIVIASKIVEAAQAHFVKTSTGFSKGGATVENVQLIKATVPNMLIKASGGIKDIETALQLIDAGAMRLGLSSSKSIIDSRNDLLKPIVDLKQ